MLSLTEIRKFYPESLQHAGEFLLREYLQYKLLELLYESEYAGSLVFLGGTCLRMIHGNQRFSEDLDFDNRQPDKNDFVEIPKLIKKGLELEGYKTELKVVHGGAFHCYIRFPGILYDEGLSGYKEQKILVRLDTEPQEYAFTPDKILLNKFDVFTEIYTTPLPLLLAQKYFTVLNRKRNKGRDFYDIVFLNSRDVQPDFGYLSKKAGIKNWNELKKVVLEHCSGLDMDKMATDVAPFLFRANDAKKVSRFPELIRQL